MNTNTQTDEQTEHWTDRPLVRPLWARILVGMMVAGAGLIGGFYVLRGLSAFMWEKDIGRVPDTPATAPFPSGEFPEWGGTEGPVEWLLHMLVWCGVYLLVVVATWGTITLLVEPLSDFGDPLSTRWGLPLVVVISAAVLATSFTSLWVPSSQHQDEWQEYQDQAVERFTGWAQDRYGLDLSGLDEGVVLDLMDGTEDPVLLGDGRMLGAYESHGELVLTRGGEGDELEVVADDTSGGGQ